MMDLKWSSAAVSDLVRLHDFLSPINSRAAAAIIQSLTNAPERLLQHPRIGKGLEEFRPREVRWLLVGKYEMRYEVSGSTIHILRIWHSREDR